MNTQSTGLVLERLRKTYLSNGSLPSYQGKSKQVEEYEAVKAEIARIAASGGFVTGTECALNLMPFGYGDLLPMCLGSY